MEMVTSGGDLHLSLLRSLFDVNLFILFGYLLFVAVQLYVITGLAIDDDVFNIGKKSIRVRHKVMMAFLSLMATWYYMFKYLLWSYNAYIERMRLSGSDLTSLPLCQGGFVCQERKLIATLMRMSSWLRDLSLFEEAWLYVVRGKLNWWWSVEICIYTVGFWALYVRTQGRSKVLPYVWAYVILGQTCAIGVAANLFNAAVATREEGFLISEKKIDEPVDDTRAGMESEIISVRQSFTLISPPRYGELLFTLLVALLGLAIVSMIPSTLSYILIMHLGPMLMVMQIVLPQTVVDRSLRPYFALSTVYAVIAIVSLGIRIKSHLSVWSEFNRLVPTFLSHPAQSSISSDTVCITISAIVELYEYYQKEKLERAEAIVFVAMTPLLGPSFTMAASHALMQRRLELSQDKSLWSTAGKDIPMNKDGFLERSVTTSTTYTVSRHQHSSILITKTRSTENE